MTPTPTLDVSNPASANTVGTELATITDHLTTQLADCTVTDHASLEQAVSDRQAIGDAAKRVEAYFKPLKDMAHKLHRAICDRENSITGPLLQLDRHKVLAIAAYKRAQDELRAQQERAQAEARRREDQTRAAAEAAALETDGESALAAAVLEESISAPLPVVALPDPTRAVVHFRRDWKWRYAVDEARAVQLLPREYLMVDPKKLTSYAKSFQGSANLPGIQVYYDDVPLR